MSQIVHALFDGEVRSLELPDVETKVMPGIPWDRFECVLTPAYWASQAWMYEPSGRYHQFRLGRSLEEETAACLLGGHGIAGEVNIAAFRALRQAGLLGGGLPSQAQVYQVLSQPLAIGDRWVRYRFAPQRSRFISQALEVLSRERPDPADHRHFRDWLVEHLPGVGLKTASWITRNHLGSDEVAILDIHIYRAGRIMGLFDARDNPARNYLSMEARFLQFAQGIGVRPSILDNLMWDHMRTMPRTVSRAWQAVEEEG